jgi:hypothetical protein
MKRRVAIGRRKDMKEIKVCKHMKVKKVPKIKLGIFAPLILGEGYKRRRVHHVGRTRAIENQRCYTGSKRAMERMGMKERAKVYYYAIIIDANLCCHS